MRYVISGVTRAEVAVESLENEAAKLEDHVAEEDQS